MCPARGDNTSSLPGMRRASRPSQLRAAAEEAAILIPSSIGLQKRYGRLEVPALIVAGEQDRYVDSQRHSTGGDR